VIPLESQSTVGAALPCPSPPSDRERIDRCLAAFLSRSKQAYARNDRLSPLHDRLSRFVLQGGKRVRPRLCLASYRIVSGRRERPPRSAWLVSSALELFHSFMLIHDDITDESEARRGEATLHEAIRFDLEGSDKTRTAARRASSLALIGGDLLFALGTQLVAMADLEPGIARGVQRHVTEMLIETGFGQALDVLYEDDPLDRIGEPEIIDAYLKKTACYTVSGPLVLGATLAGASRPVCQSLRRFGCLLGLAYQLRNDLDALETEPGQDDHDDLDTAKRTVTLWTAYHRLGPADRIAFEAELERPPSVERRRALWSWIQRSGAVQETERRWAGLLEEATHTLRDSPFDDDQRRALFRLLELLPGASPAAERNSNPIHKHVSV